MKNKSKKNLSIKFKITLWFTLFVSFITIVSLFFIFSITKKLTNTKIRDDLKNSVYVASYNATYVNNNILINEKSIDKIENVKILIYDENMNLIYGKGSYFLIHKPLINKDISKIYINDVKYYVYDYKIPIKHNKAIWVRGVTSLNSIDISTTFFFKLAIIIFPFLIIVAAIGGYIITKKAFKPIKEITNIANNINGSNDLSKRITIHTKSKDEISALCETFNNMFIRLENSFENERQFTSDASHELRTPTSVIMAHAEYLLSIAKDEDEIKTAKIILKQSKKMSSLISKLLMLARMDHNKEKLNFEYFNFSELVQIVIDELNYSCKNKNIKLITNIQNNLKIYADETLIMRMLINLITNAINYSNENGYIKISVYMINNNIVGEISDNGIGISKENQNKIWDRFYQVDPSRNKDKGSSGLGLSIVKWIVNAHNGTIEVKSKINKGSTFTFIIPSNIN